MKKVKICFVFRTPGGPMDRRALYFKKYLENAGNFIVTIVRKNKLPHKSTGTILPLVRMLSEIKKESPDLVYALDGAGYAALVGLFSKFLFKNKFVVDTGDLSYESEKISRQHNLIRLQIVRLIEEMALKYADAIVVRGSYHKEYLEKRGYQNIFFIPDGVDTSFSKPVDSFPLRLKLNLENKLVIGIMGVSTYSKIWKITRGWELIWLLKELKNEPIFGLYIGGGTGLEYLKKWAREFKILDKILFLGQIPYEGVPKYLSLIDLCLLTMPPRQFAWVRTTGKLTEYLAAGKFIIGSNLKGNAKEDVEKIGLILPHKGGFDQEYIKAMAQIIKKILKNRQILEKGKKGIQIAKEKYEFRVLAQKLAQILPVVVS